MSNYDYFKQKQPSSIKDSVIFDKVYKSIGNQLDKLLSDKNDLILQLNPQTCTWSIDMWEDMCSIQHSSQLLDIRRANVIVKLSRISPITRVRMENVVKNFVEDSFVENILNEYAFRINLNGEFDFDLQELRKVIEDIKPAHLDYLIRYFINYFCNYKFSISTLIESKVSFYTSAFNIPTHLLLNGQATLDGRYYLNGATRPDGIKKIFYFITEKIFSHLVGNDVNVNVTSFIKGSANNNIVKNYDGGSYRFKALNGKYKLNDELDLSNKTELIQNI